MKTSNETTTPLATVDRKTFLEALKKLEGVVEKTPRMPVLGSVLITINEVGKVSTLQATDMEISKTVPLFECDPLNTGNVVMPLKTVVKVLKALKSDKITLSTDKDHWLHITDGRSMFGLVGFDNEEFPAIRIPDTETVHAEKDVDPQALYNALLRVDKAISSDPTRTALSAVLIDQMNTAHIVATDGHRLHMVKTDLNIIEMGTAALLPLKAVKLLLNNLKKHKEPLRIYSDEEYLTIFFGRDFLTIRLIKETYPSYNNVIPASNDNRYTVPVDALTDCLKQCALMSTDKHKGVKMTFSPGNVLTVKSNGSEFGEYEGIIDIARSMGSKPDRYVGLNIDYILDYTKQLPKGSVVTFHLKDEQTAVLLTSEDAPGYDGVIVPMRI